MSQKNIVSRNLVRVIISDSEANANIFKFPLKFSSYAEVNKWISYMRNTITHEGTYLKARYILEFEDGFSYGGRFDISKEDDSTLKEHVRNVLSYIETNKPEWLEAEDIKEATRIKQLYFN